MTDAAVAELAGQIGVAAACRAVGRNRATHHRRHRKSPAPARPAPVPQRERAQPAALTEEERHQVLAVLHSHRFADAAPAQVWATLLDEGSYLCSEATMYRLLRERGETPERRRQASHPAHVKPELVAARRPEPAVLLGHHQAARAGEVDQLLPLRRPRRLLPLLVGWTVAATESSALARQLLTDVITAHAPDPAALTIHADRGPSMTSKPVAFLLADLGVTKTHSRPRCSNDNPYSEAQFKTLKYCPDFPGRFGSIEDARAWCARFFDAYHHHRHAGLGLLTPATVHFGHAQAVHRRRAAVLTTAAQRHPNRFRKPPQPPRLPEPPWINKLEPSKEAQ